MKTAIYFEEEMPATLQISKITSMLYGALNRTLEKIEGRSKKTLFLRCWQAGKNNGGKVAARCTIGYPKELKKFLEPRDIDAIEDALERLTDRMEIIFARRKSYSNIPWIECYVAMKEREQ